MFKREQKKRIKMTRIGCFLIVRETFEKYGPLENHYLTSREMDEINELLDDIERLLGDYHG